MLYSGIEGPYTCTGGHRVGIIGENQDGGSEKSSRCASNRLLFLLCCDSPYNRYALEVEQSASVQDVCQLRRLPHFFSADLTQAWYGKLDDLDLTDAGSRLWPPPIVLEYYSWWCKEVDPLVAVNPLWYVRTAS